MRESEPIPLRTDSTSIPNSSQICAISFMKDIHRLFQYHGAEHKTIACHESKERLTVENVKNLFELGYTFGILGSDLFILSAWVKKVQELLASKN